MPAVLALQERFNFTSHAESPPLFYIHFFILRADRIIVGEIRDSAAIDLLTAMNTGHDGSLSTGHANSPKDMLNRLETLFLMGLEIPLAAIRQQIASGIDIMIHLGRLRDKSRRVLEISEVGSVVDGKIELHPLFVFEEQGETDGRVKGHLVRTKAVFSATEKAERAGVIL
jgi:pilus assembly protein cpaF